MTGQVKEEILTRWGELGIEVVDGCAAFAPKILRKSEFFQDGPDAGTLRFTWCGVPVTYRLAANSNITVNGTRREGSSLTAAETADLFSRNGKITDIIVEVKM